jgi:hypothetical protein
MKCGVVPERSRECFSLHYDIYIEVNNTSLNSDPRKRNTINIWSPNQWTGDRPSGEQRK